MTVQEQYEGWWAEIKPHVFSLIQEREMQRSFYAGCLSMLHTIKELGCEDLHEDAQVLKLEMMQNELRAFFDAIRDT